MAGLLIQKVLMVILIAPWLGEGASLSAEARPVSGPALSQPSPTALTEATLTGLGPKLFDPPDPSALDPETGSADHGLLLPDLQVLPPFDLQLKRNARTGRTHLRMAITFWNDGQGPLELHGVFNPASRRTQVWQSLHAPDDTTREHWAGEFIWHPGHDHWHFADFAVYELWVVSPDGALDRVVASSGKVTFCILETDVMDSERPDFSRWRRYAVCGPGRQGLSVGWGDTYDSDLDGQTVEITDVPDGLYALTVTVDPANRIREANDVNNTAVTYLEIARERLYVFWGEEGMFAALRLCLRLC